MHFEPFSVGGGSNELHDDFEANERFATPILADEGEQAVFDFVPLACARRQVCDLDRQTALVGKVLKFFFPEPVARAVTASAVGFYVKPVGFRIKLGAHRGPPILDGGDGKRSSVVVGAHAHPALIVGEVVNAVGVGSPEFWNDKVVHAHRLRMAFQMPLAAAVFEVSDEFLFLRVNGDDGLAFGLGQEDALVDVFELGVAIGMGKAFAGFDIGLQAVTLCSEEFGYELVACREALLFEFGGEMADAFGGPK